MDIYSDRIAIYEECSRLLEKLDEEKDVSIGMVARMSGQHIYLDRAVEELIKVGAAKRGENGNLLCTELTSHMRILGYFQEKIYELENQQRLDKLNERSVLSSEKSANAANRSAKSAEYANQLAIFSIIISFIGCLLSGILTKCCCK